LGYSSNLQFCIGSNSLNRFENLLIEEIPSLRRYAWALSGDANQADDLVQDCLARAISRRKLWISHKGMRPWLFTIMHNIYINAARRALNAPVVGSIEDYAKSSVSLSDADIICAISDFEQSLNQLTFEHREALLLVGLEQLSYKEASKVVGVPVGTIMSRLSRAREQLRKSLYGEPQATGVRRVI
jgi:RNA polymerase sigma-70 factor (ECF subfamily)